MPKIITVSGPIGAGKSTFIERYAQHLRDIYNVSVRTCYEFVDNNELLTLMYSDPERWTYTSQVRFLTDKVRSLTEASKSSESIVLIERDYSELLLFIEAQRNIGSVTQLEYESYVELYTLLKKFLPPVLNYYVDVPFDVCTQRMQKRGRECESLGNPEYYKTLHDLYQLAYRDAIIKVEDNLDRRVYWYLDDFTLKGVLRT